MADLLVALTGGIASGKSTVSSHLERLGAIVIDSDQIAREVVAPGSLGLQQIREHFGPGVFDGDQLNRSKLGQLVFGDKQKRLELEGILHPLIQKESKSLFDKLSGIVVYQIPLLVESNAEYDFDAVVTVEADEQTRVSRLADDRGMPEEDAKARISAQASRSERERVSDFVIDSDCELDELERRVAIVWEKLVEMRNSKQRFS